MDALLERFRGFWEGLNDRERAMMSGLAIVLGLLVMGLPLGLIATESASLQDENDEMRAVLELLSERREQLVLQEDARKTAETRYRNQTPPLGSFLEGEAKKHGLTLFEVTEQPEKSEAGYLRRAVRAGINDVNLTGIMNLLNGIVRSPHPVAIDHVQIEHYQPGDQYRLKLGVLTFDRKAKSAAKDEGAGG